jgi:hypothetical protein
MYANDKDFYLRMVALWQLTELPGLKATIVNERVRFTFFSRDRLKFSRIGAPKPRFITELPVAMFYQLEPIEILSVLERAIEKKYAIDARSFRSPLDGFKKNPFSSQN